ncbi:MBL fold metallo-hydrolase [Microbacterium foliorum]
MRVVDVGDAACSVYAGPDDFDPTHVMVVDCGAGRHGTASDAAIRLAAALGVKSGCVDTVVITHFDEDHWRGLRELPQHWVVPPSDVTLHYPYLLPQNPGLIQVAYLAIASLSHQPVTAALDVIHAWEVNGETTVRPRALMRGDTFDGAGQLWTVHWPPRDHSSFTKRTRNSMDDMAQRIRDVAAQSPLFRLALLHIQRAWFRQEDGHDGIDRLSGGEVNGQLRADAGEAPTAREVVEQLVEVMSFPEFENFRALVRKYTNELSIVHTTDTVANFGDCESAGLTALLKLQGDVIGPKLAAAYPVILSPHHGTQAPRKRVQELFPFVSDTLVCQNGIEHHRRGLEDDIQVFRRRATRLWSAHVHNTFVGDSFVRVGL